MAKKTKDISNNLISFVFYSYTSSYNSHRRYIKSPLLYLTELTARS
jgi:hypothetical protein